MERKKPKVEDVIEQTPQEEIVEFVKFGRGSLRFPTAVPLGSQKNERGTIIKPNQHFWARPSEIPAAFRDVVRPVRGLPPEPPLNPVAPGYKKRQNADNPKLWDVVDMQDKAMNEQPLTEKEADELILALR